MSGDMKMLRFGEKIKSIEHLLKGLTVEFLISYLKHWLNHTRFGESYSILILKRTKEGCGIQFTHDQRHGVH